MKILYILRHDPWGIGGGCYACRNYLEVFLEVFAEAEADVLVCSEYLREGKPDDFRQVRFVGVKPRTMAQKLMTPLSGVLHRYQQVAKQMISQGGYDVCIFDHNALAGTLVGLCREFGVKTIVLNHNFEQEYFRDNTPSYMRRMLLLPVVRRNEQKSYLGCDVNIFLTDEDRELFARIYGSSKTSAIVGGCFMRKGDACDISQLKPFHTDRLRMVISGTIGNVQNLDGIIYFLNHLYPYISVDMDVVIAGKNPPAALIEKLKEYANVSLVSNPKNMDMVLRDCDIFLCPARLGGGMKLRVMDGLRNGLPVIAHQVSARGYGMMIFQGVMSQFATPQEFAQNLANTIQDIKKGNISKQDIYNTFVRTFSFDVVAAKIKNNIKKVI